MHLDNIILSTVRILESQHVWKNVNLDISNLVFRDRTRHFSFRNIGELLAILIREAPSDIYCSNGFYRFPTYPMQEKQWGGADLIFDIDAKDLQLPVRADTFLLLYELWGSIREEN